MKTTSEMQKTLQEDKKNRIIELYLREKFRDTFQPTWLDTPDNYRELAKALNFLYNLEDDKLSLTAIGSENEVTRRDYKKHFEKLTVLLDSIVEFSKETPPVALAFNEKEAVLKAIAIKQEGGALSLRDLHAQSSNLGVAEKLLNAELGESEWLSDVDLERALTKLGVKDRVHITRLNPEDIGMILHFERVKHGDGEAPYTIPLLINCGSSGSLRSQGSHWTEALITVDPTGPSITVNYRDSMQTDAENIQHIINEAIRYEETSNVNGVIKQYSAFPNIDEEDIEITVVSDDSQDDTWSCGYRALHNLLSHPNFPTAGINIHAAPWTTIVNCEYASIPLRNAMYRLLLDDLQINEEFFAAMQLDKEAFKHLEDPKTYGLDKGFTDHYLDLLSEHKPKTITSNDYETEYKAIIAAFQEIKFKTDRKPALDQLKKKVNDVAKDDSLSSDAKIFALLDVLANEYNAILGTMGGEGSKLGKSIKQFCDKEFGVILSKGPSYQFKKGGLLLKMVTEIGEKVEKKGGKDSLLPPPKPIVSESTKTSISTPVLGTPKIEMPKTSFSVSRVSSKSEPGQISLLKKQELSRVGTMFGPTQFCYGEKVGGVEPGFRAIDLDEAFFEQLATITLPESETGPVAETYKSLLATIKATDNLKLKQIAFATFINAHVAKPHAKGELHPTITALCEQIKTAVKNNNHLSAWLYKLDYAESGAKKGRIKANVEALREFVGTRLAGIFSDKNQKQEILWMSGPSGPHALLACGWKNDLRELKEFLHGGGAPDWEGVLVDDPKAKIKTSKHIPGLGKNLIFGLAIGDRDGVGKEAQNKGFAGKAFYGFDYGKTYDGESVCGSLKDDFSFYNPGSGAPEMLRGESKIGLYRHIMYRNYSIFNDTQYSDRMEGVHILKKMITGENPSEEILKSYPGLRQELYRIQERTPTTETLLNRLGLIRALCKEGGQYQQLIDNLSVQISTSKLSPFERYFAEIKIDLIKQALETDMNFKELNGYMTLLDGWTKKAAVNNQQILEVFAQRLSLTKEEVNFLDKMEKVFSPTSIVSHEAILNHLRITRPQDRIPFQLTNQKDGTYTLTTSNETVQAQLKDLFGLNCKVTEEGLSFNLTQKELAKLMIDVNRYYEMKKQTLLAKAMYRLETLPRLKETYPTETLLYLRDLLNHEKSEPQKAEISFLWLPDSSLSLHLILKTEEQAKQIQQIFELEETPRLNVITAVEIPCEKLQEKKSVINKYYQSVTGTLVELPNKWETIRSSKEEIDEINEEVSEGHEERFELIKRFQAFKLPKELQDRLGEAINEMSLATVETLLGYNDNTLRDKTNISHIIEEEPEKIVVIPQEIELHDLGSTSTSSKPDSTYYL